MDKVLATDMWRLGPEFRVYQIEEYQSVKNQHESLVDRNDCLLRAKHQ